VWFSGEARAGRQTIRHGAYSCGSWGSRPWANAQDIERLRQAVLDLKRSSDRIGYALVWLTLVLIVLTGALVYIAASG
jgi:hypothetical protein